jgi:hypothetical protein
MSAAPTPGSSLTRDEGVNFPPPPPLRGGERAPRRRLRFDAGAPQTEPDDRVAGGGLGLGLGQPQQLPGGGPVFKGASWPPFSPIVIAGGAQGRRSRDAPASAPSSSSSASAPPPPSSSSSESSSWSRKTEWSAAELWQISSARLNAAAEAEAAAAAAGGGGGARGAEGEDGEGEGAEQAGTADESTDSLVSIPDEDIEQEAMTMAMDSSGGGGGDDEGGTPAPPAPSSSLEGVLPAPPTGGGSPDLDAPTPATEVRLEARVERDAAHAPVPHTQVLGLTGGKQG